MNKEEMLQKLNDDFHNCNIGVENLKQMISNFNKVSMNQERDRVKLTNEVNNYYKIKNEIIRKRQRLSSFIMMLFLAASIVGLSINELFNILIFAGIVSISSYTLQEVLNAEEIDEIKEYPIIEKEAELKKMNKRAIENYDKKNELENEYVVEHQKLLEISSNIRFLKNESNGFAEHQKIKIK